MWRLVAAEGQNLAHQVARAPAGFVNFSQADQRWRVTAGVLLGQFHIAQNRADDVVEIMCNAAGHGADGLHFLRLPQLRLKRRAVRFHFFACRQVVGKQGDDIAFGIALKCQAYLQRDAVTGAGAAHHFAQLRMAGDVAIRQGVRSIGQKIGQGAAECLLCGALKNRGRRRVEDNDLVIFVHTQNRIQRRVDDGSQPGFALQQLLVALLQCLGAKFQRVALGQQRPLVNDGANEPGQVAQGVVYQGNVQIARERAV